jgi:hypothetical protein
MEKFTKRNNRIFVEFFSVIRDSLLQHTSKKPSLLELKKQISVLV